MKVATAQAKPASHQVTGLDSWRLGTRLRKTVLLLHIVAGGTWFGLDVAMAVLVFPRSAPTQTRCALTRCSRCSSSRSRPCSVRRCSA
jgi:hypothetical protein